MVQGAAAIDRELSAVAAAVGSRLSELTHEIRQLIVQSLPELQGDDMFENLLDASIEENVATVLHVLEHGTAIDEVNAPAAAHEYARRLAQREVPIVTLTRTYPIGHGQLLARCVDEVGGRSYDGDVAASILGHIAAVSFKYVDRVSGQVIATYQRERDHWLLARVAGRAARVRALLANESVDLEAAESALGYRLRRKHLGVVAWLSGEPGGMRGLAELERLASAAARALEARGRPLFVPRDEAVAWIWLPLASDAEVGREELEAAFDDGVGSVRVAVGEPAVGLDGFRQTHDQAVRAQGLAYIATPGTRVTTFAEVGALALIWADRDAARCWVLATLNDLAIDDEPHARLRETLLTYLSTGSYTATAERMTMHKNTVQYRVGKAEEALGQPIGERRADLELALRACHYLGRAVLRDS
ncbi:MAG TPA: helix-turn-helix domain-containing protein [Mycobacterium sp.]|nr:helix-turn-helix domain-containing protein [Mycobacterium sp.]